MSETNRFRNYAALILVVIFTFVTIISISSEPAYAAVRKPSKVTGVKATALSNYSIKITWKKTRNAKKYQVYRAASKKGKYRKIATVTKTSVTSSNLKKGKRYYYKVRAVNGSRKGSFSTAKYASTKKSTLYDVTVDKTAKTVTVSAVMNGRYFDESTRHLMIDRKGFNKGKAILTSYCTPDDLYNGLVKAGGRSWSKSEGKTLKMGEKNSVSNAENRDFSRIDISISWDGETHSLSECLTTEKNGNTAPDIDMIFSGNPKAAAKTPSGCMTCMDSCYIGIVANSAYGLCVIDKGEPTLYARPDVLPANNTVVKVTFTIK
ncbi:MAG: fibronectin type III domain-containing protein [Mogibacterium sp.]|nr:fibronectin type III domain-containing protein [Mogibacterium sp.]